MKKLTSTLFAFVLAVSGLASPVSAAEQPAAGEPIVVARLGVSGRVQLGGAKFYSLSIASDTNDVNLRTLYDASFPTPRAGDTVTFTIETGVVVGGTSTATPALQTGGWPDGVRIELHNLGRIAGQGANGGNGQGDTNGSAGGSGGPAFSSTVAISVNNVLGVIAGGGGGGGGGGESGNTNCVSNGGGGGGGAGRAVGSGGSVGTGGWTGTNGTDGDPGTLSAGGAGGSGGSSGVCVAGAGGDGGDAGQSGQDGANGAEGIPDPSGFPGGAAGAAIEGLASITFVDANGVPTENQGTILGPTS